MLILAYRIHRIFTFCNFELSGDSICLEASTVDASEKLLVEATGSNSFYTSIKYSSLFRAPVSHMTLR